MLYKTVVAASVVASANAFQASQAIIPANTAARAMQAQMAAKQVPHGGTLINLFAEDKAAVAASATKTIEITERQSCDVQLLCNGGLSPLTGFLNSDAYDGVVETMKLPSGDIMGLPIVMDTDDESIAVGDKVMLKYDGTDMAVMTIEDKVRSIRTEKRRLLMRGWSCLTRRRRLSWRRRPRCTIQPLSHVSLLSFYALAVSSLLAVVPRQSARVREVLRHCDP